MNINKIRIKITSNWRMMLVLLLITIMISSIGMIYSMGSGIVDNGKTDLSKVDFTKRELIALDGKWEFYWDQLLTPGDFTFGNLPKIDSLMKVPGSWHDKTAGTNVYENHGVATYRLLLKYPYALKDPALKIQRVSSAYKLYVNGNLITSVGKVSKKNSDYELDYKQLIIELPNDKQELELIIQVANLDYSRGGLRESPIFGSKQVLEQQKLVLLALQLIFIGSVFIFSVYYFLVFLLQRKNKTALLFSMLCFLVALRSSVWGETPLKIFFPNMTFKIGIYVVYITGYNLMPLIIVFVLSIYPLSYKKTSLGLILIPNLFFEAMLLAPIGILALTNTYQFLLMLLQMIYILSILIKQVLRKSENAIIMLIAIEIFILSILSDILYNKGIGSITISYMFLYGNFAVIIAMSYVQAKQQASMHKKLILYNENLVESDRLKDKIMETEMSFLQAQIKPHFLYNALNAIANVCETDGENAGKLIIDLAIYLRGSLEFNHLDKKVTIEKELEFVHRYFNIEQARFGRKIKLIMEIEITLDFQMPVLILQPLVENAVRHGISKNPEGGTVYVRMKQTVEGINIEIEDDGVGINKEKLEVLLSKKRLDQGVGLINIHHRLLRLYGKGIDISSEVGCGTCVKLVIPERGKSL